MTELIAPVPADPAAEIVAVPVATTEPTEPVLVDPVTPTSAAAATTTEPTPLVAASPVSGTLASATTETDPTAPVPATPVTTTGMGSPQVPWDHVPRAQPEIIAIGLYRLGDTDNSVTRIRCWKLNSKVTRC